MVRSPRPRPCEGGGDGKILRGDADRGSRDGRAYFRGHRVPAFFRLRETAALILAVELDRLDFCSRASRSRTRDMSVVRRGGAASRAASAQGRLLRPAVRAFGPNQRPTPAASRPGARRRGTEIDASCASTSSERPPSMVFLRRLSGINFREQPHRRQSRAPARRRGSGAA